MKLSRRQAVSIALGTCVLGFLVGSFFNYPNLALLSVYVFFTSATWEFTRYTVFGGK